MRVWLSTWLSSRPKKPLSPIASDRNRALTCGFVGALGGTRTPNLLIRSQMLYPLSYERLKGIAKRTGSAGPPAFVLQAGHRPRSGRPRAGPHHPGEVRTGRRRLRLRRSPPAEPP